MSIDRTLTDDFPTVYMNGRKYHVGRDCVYGMYVIENSAYAEDSWRFETAEELQAFLAKRGCVSRVNILCFDEALSYSVPSRYPECGCDDVGVRVREVADNEGHSEMLVKLSVNRVADPEPYTISRRQAVLLAAALMHAVDDIDMRELTKVRETQ